MRIPRRELPTRGLSARRLPDGTEVVVVVTAAGVCVLLDECPHQGLPLSAGSLGDDDAIECPFHGARFSGRDGRCVAGPATDDVPRFEAQLVGDHLQIGTRLAPG